jgi:3-dehydroquinate synthetase
MGICDYCCLRDVLDMLHRYDLPDNTHFNANVLSEACLSDKKREGEALTMIFPEEIGRCALKKIPVGELESVIRSGLEDL